MRRFFLIIGVLLFASCSNEKDEINSLMSSDKSMKKPIQFVFQFIDKETGNDLFVAKKFFKKDIEIRNEKGQKLDCETSSGEEQFLIVFPMSAGAEDGKYTIKLSSEIVVKIEVKLDVTEGSYKIKSFKIEKYEFNEHLGVIQVKI